MPQANWPQLEWRDDIKRHFPLWETTEALANWPDVLHKLKPGQAVTGTVIARAPFSVWLDIGVGFPALLLVVYMKGADTRRITFDDYPAMGERVEGWITAMGDRGEIGVTQHAANLAKFGVINPLDEIDPLRAQRTTGFSAE
jgi:hypothetical protein